jgi:ketosteroid isomerase-like protein
MQKITAVLVMAILTVSLSAARGQDTVSELKTLDAKVTEAFIAHDGDTAMVSGLLHVKGKWEDKDISPEYRWTRVYNRKKGAEWLCVLEQHTYVVPKDEGK